MTEDFSQKEFKLPESEENILAFWDENDIFAKSLGKTKNGKPKIWAHAYVHRNKFKTKHEQHLIDADTKRVKLVYRNKKYHKKTESRPSAYGL